MLTMLKLLSVLVVALLFTESIAQSNESYENSDEIVEIRDKASSYDILTLAQCWPQTSCWSLNKLWQTEEPTCSKCKMPKDKSFWTAHGLWPSNRNGKHVSHCNDEKYNPKLLSSSMRTMMEEKWPTFNLKTSLDSFWSHEWSKHGTCAMDLESTNSLPKYFSKTLQLLNQYNVGAILADSGIVPGKTYKYSDLFTVIENTLGVKTSIKCSINTISKKQYIHEFYVCFDKSFQLTDCGHDNWTNCKSEVFYPRNANTC